MQRHKFAHAFKFMSFLTFMLFTVLLTGTLYAAPKVGPVTPENSIIGQYANDRIGSDGVYSLPSGNIVIVSSNWNNKRGAVTCLIPDEYRAGGIVVSAANSLVGSTPNSLVGYGTITVMANGNFVVASPYWDSDTTTNVGAVTWVDGDTCVPFGETTRGVAVSPSNSLVGSTTDDYVGSVIALTNGNYVVRSSSWSNGGLADVGAVTWANGDTGTFGVVSPSNSLIGASTGDQISSDHITALSNGNYVVVSTYWNNGTATRAGAVTWGNGSSGTVGVVSASNSLVGSTANDRIGLGFISLSNGNYVISSRYWDNGTIVDAGVITWGNGAIGTVGVVNGSNSLVGSSSGDEVGYSLIALTNGNYVAASPYWDNSNSSVQNVGAVTWGSGTSNAVGMVSTANSLVGSTPDDQVGKIDDSDTFGVTALSNGNYLVRSPKWDNGTTINAGAVTWGNGNGGTVDVVSVGNSLVGSTTNDYVGEYDITALNNGNYVVSTPGWDNGPVANAGAVTWGNGTGGTVGVVSAANSLVGSTPNDHVGFHNVTELTNGTYVVTSIDWDNGTVDNAGAVTWANGTGGTVGVVSAANSLVGSTAGDQVGANYYFESIAALTNGNYVVTTLYWDNDGAVDVGAATWGNGTGGTVGVVSAANSLIGSTAYDGIGARGVTVLTNGNYVVRSPYWINGTVILAGAATWGSGTGGTVGLVSSDNSLVGSTEYDGGGEFGTYSVTALSNGNYVVTAPEWVNNTVVEAGAATWGSGTGGTVGVVTPDNSLVGTTEYDRIGLVTPLADGSYLVSSSEAHGSKGVVVWSEGTLTPANNTPVLAEIGNKTVDVGATVTFDAEATDSDAPAQTLTYSIEGAPEDATFDTATGEFSWTTDEADGEQTFNVTVTVTDNGEPALSDSEAFTITVNDMNNAPVLAEIGNQTVDEGDALMFDANASDVDAPPQTLIFSIDGAPEDASFDTATGEFSWTAGEEDGGQTFNVTVTVTDNGEPAANDSEDFTITVNPVVVEETNYLPNASFENPGTTNKTAAGWTGVGLTKNDKRICDTDTKTYAHDGECAFRFQFNGASNPARTLQRNLNVQNFAKNEVMELRGIVKAKGLTAGARLFLKVVYKNGKTEAVSVKLLPGNYEYSPFATQITLKRPAKKITVQIKAGSAKGIFFVDDMAVVKVAAPLTINDGATDSGLRGLD